MSFQRSFIKRDTDIPVFMRWIKKNDSVIDLGCGRGLLLERLAAEKQVKGFGIERNPEKILQCLERRVNVIQGDIFDALCKLPDNSADWVVCSRILQELEHPAEVILRALRVGTNLAIAFVNNGHWRNRMTMFRYGHRARNSIYPDPWDKSKASNPVSIRDFEEFCEHYGISILRREYMAGDWRTPRAFMPKLFAGYGIYALSRS